MPGNLALCVVLRAANDADWMESLVRTISRGYVKNTEVIPAAPPQINRLREERSCPGEGSKNCTKVSQVLFSVPSSARVCCN